MEVGNINNLILLTKNFPYGSGEAFINNELKILLGSFDRIIIIATNVSYKSQQTAKVPENVIIEKITMGAKLSRLIDGLKALKYLLCSNEAIAKDKEKVKGSLKKKFFLSYFEAKSMRIYKEVSRILKDYSFKKEDKVVIYSYWFFDTAYIAGKLKNEYFLGRDVKAVSRAHGYDIYEYRTSLNYLPMRELILDGLDFLYPCSKDGEKYLKNLYPRYKDKIKAIYLGTMDRGLEKNYPTDVFNTDVFNIVSCSYVIPLKRVHLIVEALSHLCNSNIKIKWTHIGNGSIKNSIEELAKEKLKGSVSYELLGEMPNNRVMDFYRENNINLFINLSETEGLPVSIMEAISFGIPVIATNVGGTNEIVIDGVSGKIVEKDFDVLKLSDEIKKIINMNREEYLKLRESSRKLWENNFDANKNYNAFIDELLIF